jgi:ADP-heptose:LPS heptosyltransferase
MEHRRRAEPFSQVERIAVLRGGGIGDLIVVEPALRALADAYPAAEITLLGSPGHGALLCDRPGPVSRVVTLPFSPGIRDGQPTDDAATAAFLQRMRDTRFDLAVQLHGGGRFSNPFLLQLGATHTAGMATPDAVALERTVPYRYYQHETMRALEVAAAAGAQPVSLEAVIEVRECEFASAAALLPPGDAPLLVIHPGASDPRRRWPADRFAKVAASASAAGARVVVVGDESEAELSACVVGMANGGAGAGSVTSLAGRLTLGELAGVFAHAQVVLANDSGPRHLAQAVGAATVGIYWIGNLINAGPLTRSDHRVELSWTTRCPVCEVDVTQATGQRCPHDVSFVADVPTSAVEEDVAELMARNRPLRG